MGITVRRFPGAQGCAGPARQAGKIFGIEPKALGPEREMGRSDRGERDGLEIGEQVGGELEVQLWESEAAVAIIAPAGRIGATFCNKIR